MTTIAAAPVRRKKSRFALTIGLLTLLILIIFVLVKRGKWQNPTQVTTERVAIRNIVHFVTAAGKVQPETEVKVSSEAAGELIALPFKEGALVKKGELVARVNPDSYQAQIEQQEAVLVAAKSSAALSQAQLAKAEQGFRQKNELYKKKFISDEGFTAAKTNLDVGRAKHEADLAQIRRTKGALTQYRDKLNKTMIYAPMSGTISALGVEVGERVASTGQFKGTEIMRIADLDTMEARVKVNESDIVSVKPGDHANVSIDALPGRKFDGTVYEISSSALTAGNAGSGNAAPVASASNGATNFLVKISLSGRENDLRPGMSATADIVTQTANNVVSVPIQSVTVSAADRKTAVEPQQQKTKEEKKEEHSGNKLKAQVKRQNASCDFEKFDRVVFICTGNHVNVRKVETGIADNAYIEIQKGINVGDEIVSGSYAAISQRLKDGSKVLVQRNKKKSDK